MRGSRFRDVDLVTAVVRGTLQPSGFDRRAHVRVACALLGCMPFLDACIAMRDGLASLATRTGKPALYHETLPVALMSLLAERLERISTTGTTGDGEALLAEHPELLDRAMLAGHYSPEMLARAPGRRRFVLPDPGLRRERPRTAAPSSVQPETPR